MSSQTQKSFIDDGGDGAVPVVFLHSLAGNTRQWAAQLSHVRQSRRAIAIDLPGNDFIDGFVFVGDFLSPALLADYEADQADLLESTTLAGEPCDAFRQSRFNVRMLELVAAVRNEILDEITSEYVAQWRSLGQSLTPLAE